MSKVKVKYVGVRQPQEVSEVTEEKANQIVDSVNVIRVDASAAGTKVEVKKEVKKNKSYGEMTKDELLDLTAVRKLNADYKMSTGKLISILKRNDG